MSVAGGPADRRSPGDPGVGAAQAAPLTSGRQVALDGLLAGRPAADVGSPLGWSAERVRREAGAALIAHDPVRLATLEGPQRRQELARLLEHGSEDEPAGERPRQPAAQEAASTQDADPAETVAVPERPAVASTVLLEEGPAGTDHYVVSDAGRAIYLRMRPEPAQFLRSLDGSRDVDELEQRCGTLDPSLVRPLLWRLAQIGLLEGFDPETTDRTRARVRAADRTRIQLSLANPDVLLSRALPLFRALGSPAGLALGAVVLAGGLLAFAAAAEVEAITTSFATDPVVLVTLVVAVLATVALHELGHAAAVKFHGGRVHRMGVMIFYVAPAMFCDTSDAWRFHRPGQRVAVSLAGIAVQLVVTALVSLLLLAPLGDGLRAWVTLYAIANVGMCVVNLIPLVKLDGYWALVALVDRPNLRADALGLVRDQARRLAFGLVPERPRTLSAPGAHLLFGLAALAFGPLLVLSVLLQYQGLLLGLGAAGAATWLLIAALVVAGPVAGLVRAVRAAAAQSPGAARRGVAVIVGAVLVTGVVTALASVPTRAEGEFARLAPTGVRVELPAGKARVGDLVELTDSSLMAPTALAEGEVRATREGEADVAVRGVPPGGLPAQGRARITVEERRLPAWLLHTYLVTPVEALW